MHIVHTYILQKYKQKIESQTICLRTIVSILQEKIHNFYTMLIEQRDKLVR